MDFDAWSGQAWDRHGDDPAAVAAEIGGVGARAVASEAQLSRLATLAHHVWGEHLARWSEGAEVLRGLGAHPHYSADGDSGKAVRLYLASLALCAGTADHAGAMPPPERVRALALAAGNLAPHDTPRALALFRQALDGEASLPEMGPHVRTLAITGNNLASTLEEKPQRSRDERELMILAAQTARRCWAVAGGWLETERAEYRLAQTWLKAGDPEQAREHALQCLEIVEDHGGVPLERFFGWEVLALAERAAGDTHAYTQAVARAREAFDALDESDRGWCRPSLDALSAA